MMISGGASTPAMPTVGGSEVLPTTNPNAGTAALSPPALRRASPTTASYACFPSAR
jgi:hypothetical protein